MSFNEYFVVFEILVAICARVIASFIVIIGSELDVTSDDRMSLNPGYPAFIKI